MPRLITALSCIISGLLLNAAFPPFDFFPALLAALVPFLSTLQKCSGKGAWRRGYLFGFVFALGRLYWLDAFIAKWTGSVLLAALPWLVACLLYALYFGLAGVLIRRCLVRGWLWAIPIVWAGVEVFRSYIPAFAFPWGLLAIPLAQWPVLMSLGHYGTIFFCSAWIVLINLGFLCIYSRGTIGGRNSLGVNMAWAVLVIVAVGLFYGTPTPASKPLKVLIGQPGVDLAFGDVAQMDEKLSVSATAIVAEAEAERSQLLVLPEGVSHEYESGHPLPPFRLSATVPMLFGGERGRNPVYQDAFGYDGKWQHVDKTRLVIFGEFVPGRDFIPFLSSFHLPSGDLSPGVNGTQAMNLSGVRIGPLICFESLFPDISYRQSMNGSQLLAVISIDDWYMNSYAPEELQDASIWRSVETGLPTVRSASLGRTLAIDAKGQVLASAPVGRAAALPVVMQVPVSPAKAFWLPAFPIFSLLFGVFVLFRRL